MPSVDDVVPDLELRAVFRVSAHIGGVWGGGMLSISADAIEFQASRSTRAFSSGSGVLHRGRTVTLVRARFMPPWYDTGLLLTGDGGSAVAITPLWVRRDLKAALERAGYEVNEVVTRLSLRGIGSVPAPDGTGGGTSGKRRAWFAVGTVLAGIGAVVLLWQYPLLLALVVVSVTATLVALWKDIP